MGDTVECVSNGNSIRNDRMDGSIVYGICHKLTENFNIFCDKAAEAVPDDKKEAMVKEG